MRYYKRLKIYKASNVTFNPQTMEAHSYVWWKFVALVDGKVVFNNYRYSPSTGQHQSKIRRVMDELGIKVDMFLPIPEGIKHGQTLEDLILIAEEYLCDDFLWQKLKAQENYLRQKEKRIAKAIEERHLKDMAYAQGLSLVGLQ
jgi:hypothetical protein